MENHPIPQDVTGFKFKLIGSITVKQFGYLVAASVICYIIYSLPGLFLVKLPFLLLFGLTGIGLAFVPIDGRPMDLMLWYFVKAIPQDNQYIFKKSGLKLSIMQILQSQPYQSPKNPKDLSIRRKPPLLPKQSPPLELEPQETQFIDSIKNIFSTLPPLQDMAIHPTPAPTPAPENQIRELLKNTTALFPKTNKGDDKNIEKEENNKKSDFFGKKEKKAEDKTQPPAATQTSQKTLDEDVLHARYLELAKQQVAPSQKQPATPPKTSTRVRFLGQEASIKAGFPLIPDTPNIILGIVKDPRGKILPNVLVEIFDKNNIPVRAFKTSQLGQFASATPLPNGIYTLHFDDPLKKNEFDTIKLELKGVIMQPVEVTSIDEREKLRQELFGK